MLDLDPNEYFQKSDGTLGCFPFVKIFNGVELIYQVSFEKFDLSEIKMQLDKIDKLF